MTIHDVFWHFSSPLREICQTSQTSFKAFLKEALFSSVCRPSGNDALIPFQPLHLLDKHNVHRRGACGRLCTETKHLPSVSMAASRAADTVKAPAPSAQMCNQLMPRLYKVPPLVPHNLYDTGVLRWRALRACSTTHRELVLTACAGCRATGTVRSGPFWPERERERDWSLAELTAFLHQETQCGREVMPHPETLPAKLVIYMQQKQLKLSAFLRSADPTHYQQHSMVQTFASMPLGTIFNRTRVLLKEDPQPVPTDTFPLRSKITGTCFEQASGARMENVTSY